MTDDGPETTGHVVDTMVLAMFVDAGRADLLSDLADGRLFVSPAILDPDETPPFSNPPTAEFARGAFYLQERQGNPLMAVRFHRRMAFYLDVYSGWQPIVLSVAELRQAESFIAPATGERARAIDPSRRIVRISRGEAECAAVARGWTLWTDDRAILDLLEILHPNQPVARISDLLSRAAHTGLLSCQEAADLYNDVFKATLGLWMTRSLACVNGEVVVR